jgi:hypothetical protein
MRALRLPTRASAVAYLVRFRRPRLPPVWCSPQRSRKAGGASRARALRYRLPKFPALVRGREWDLSGLQAVHPVPLLRSWTPVESMCPRHGGHTDAAPAIRTAKASALADFGADWRSFGTCCPTLRASHCCSRARLASGWPARPLPGGSRTLWIAARGFSSC